MKKYPNIWKFNHLRPSIHAQKRETFKKTTSVTNFLSNISATLTCEEVYLFDIGFFSKKGANEGKHDTCILAGKHCMQRNADCENASH